MEEERIDQAAEKQDTYVPRPAWQVWAARIALVAFIGIMIMYYINIARGGL